MIRCKPAITTMKMPTRLLGLVMIGILLGPVAARAQTEEVVFYHTDAVGSVRMVTSETGVVIARYDYLPFGEPWPDPPTVAEVRQFAGKERDDTKLDYFGARYYAGRIGRFTTVDPGHVGGDILNPQSWNAYAYANNNPFTFVDPYGLDWFEVNGRWEYLDGVREIYQYRYDRSGRATGAQVVRGISFGLVFDGTSLVELRSDGTTRSFAAVSGRVSGWGEVRPELQSDRDVGPIPEGKYEFDPSSIQSISLRNQLLGWIGRGEWPGSTYAWGTQRVFLKPLPGTNTRGRGGFSIHGGARPGSAGCIDLCGSVNTLFRDIPRGQGPVLVDVNYKARIKR